MNNTKIPLTKEKNQLCKHLVDIMEKKHMRGEEVTHKTYGYDLLVKTTNDIIQEGSYSIWTAITLNELRKKYIKELKLRYDK